MDPGAFRGPRAAAGGVLRPNFFRLLIRVFDDFAIGFLGLLLVTCVSISKDFLRLSTPDWVPALRAT